MAEYLRLTDYALHTNEPRIVRTVEVLYDAGSIMARDIPFAVHNSLWANGSRFDGEVPTPTWMDVNDPDIPEGHSVPSSFQEQAYLFRHKVRTDRAILTDKNQFQDPHAFSIRMFLKGVSYDFNDKFINNKHATGGDTKAFVGIRARLDAPLTYGTLSANKMDAGAVDLSSAGADASSFGDFCEIMDEFLYNLDSPDGTGVTLYMPIQLQWRLNALARKFSGSGGFSQATDQLGRVVMGYRNAIFRDPGRKADQSTHIMTVTETATGAADTGGTACSIYGVKYGGEGLVGWTHLPLVSVDLPDPDMAAKVTLIEWMGGIMVPNSKAIGRVYNIKMS